MFFDKTSATPDQWSESEATTVNCLAGKKLFMHFAEYRIEMTQKLYYKVASSQLPAPRLAPRTKVVLESRQFSSSSSPATPRTKVVLQSRQFSSSSSPDTPRTKVVLQSRQFSASSFTDCSAY